MREDPSVQADLVVLFEPRAWQNLAFERWVRSDRRGVVSVVTGGGKTRLAEMCVADFLGDGFMGRVIIVVPTIALVDQWAVSLQEDLGLHSSRIGLFAEGKTPAEPTPISVLTLVSAREHAPGLASHGPTMLIVDECHRIGSPVNALALDATYTATLGLSATPERDFDDGFEDLVAPALGEVFFRYGYTEARADGVIAPFDLINVRVPLLPTRRKNTPTFPGASAASTPSTSAARTSRHGSGGCSRIGRASLQTR